MKVVLPLWIQNLNDGPHKRDMIKHYKRKFRKDKYGKCGKLTASPNRG